jgi:hypothetical protein
VADGWVVDVQGRVFERESRAWTLGAIEKVLELEPGEIGSDANRIFQSRVRALLADGERGKTVWVETGPARARMRESGSGGGFAGEIRLTAADARSAADPAVPGRIRLRVALAAGDGREFVGEAWLLGETGLSVVSDIDDTIKASDVRDRRRLIRRTFLEPFVAVPGMAAVYRQWAAGGAQFHYVSGSPWQLFEPLAEFLRGDGFPAGSLHLRQVRLTDRTIGEMFKSPREHKLRAIGGLMREFPRRRFILVGDSGEEDPEVYGEIARAHPEAVERILIRNVTSENRTANRYTDAFRQVPSERWEVFERPEEIAGTISTVSDEH